MRYGVLLMSLLGIALVGWVVPLYIAEGCVRACPNVGKWALYVARYMSIGAGIVALGLISWGFIAFIWVFLGMKNSVEKIKARWEERRGTAARSVEKMLDDVACEIAARKANLLPPGKPRYSQGEGTMYGAGGEELK